jgi:hypothetical protein
MRPNNIICSYKYNNISISTDLDWIIQAKVAIFIIRCSAASGKTFTTGRWTVEMTFLPPPLDFDQSGHTQPSLRHHGSIYVDRFGYDATNSGEMSHRRHQAGSSDIVYSSLAMFGGGSIHWRLGGSCSKSAGNVWRHLCGLLCGGSGIS